MIRIHACAQKKVPMPGYEFSSQSFSAGLEVEASDADDPEAIRRRLRELYLLLNQAVDEQIAAAGQVPGAGQAGRPAAPTDANGNGKGSRAGRNGGREVKATAAQARAIKSIAAEQGLDLAEVLAPYGVTDPAALTIRDASTTIDALKARKGNSNRR